MNSFYPWLILLAPLVSATVITLVTLRWKSLSSAISITAVSLFMFAMLGIVFANNFVMLFIFWELVGFTSYVLIGHWFFRDAAADAANKAFITTRIGDFGFMTGILMVWVTTGSVVFTQIAQRLWILTSHPAFLTIAALLLFCGAVGKSAQFPL